MPTINRQTASSCQLSVIANILKDYDPQTSTQLVPGNFSLVSVEDFWLAVVRLPSER